MPPKNTRQKRLLDKERKRQSRNQTLQVTAIENHRRFFNPVDLPWQTEKCEQLSLTLHASSRVYAPYPHTVLHPPAQTKVVRGDGNCFFRAIAYCLTGDEEDHGELRAMVVSHIHSLDTDAKRRIGYDASGNMDQYRTWATDVEIHASAHLLRTCILVFTKYGNTWTWLCFSPQQVDPGVVFTDKAMYLQHTNLNHYDVVLTVSDMQNHAELVNSPSMKSSSSNVEHVSRKSMWQKHHRQTMSDNDKLHQRMKDCERKKKERLTITPEKKEDKLKKDRERKLLKKQSMSPNQQRDFLASDKKRKNHERMNASPIKKKERKILESARKADERNTLTPEKKEDGLKKDRERQDNARKFMAPEKKEDKLKKDRERQDNARKFMAPEKKEDKLKKDRERQDNARKFMAPEKKEDKLKKDRERQDNARKFLAPEKKEDRLKKDRERKLLKKQSMSPNQQRDFLASDKKRKNHERMNASLIKKKEGKILDSARKADERNTLTPEKKEDGLKKDRERQDNARKFMAPEKKEDKLKKDRERQNNARKFMAPEKKEDRLKKDRLRKTKSKTSVFKQKTEQNKSWFLSSWSEYPFDGANTDPIRTYRRLISEGPVCVCQCCRRFLYRKSVVKLHLQKLSFLKKVTKELLDACVPRPCEESDPWICKTCVGHIKNGKLPPQAYTNKMELSPIPDALNCLSDIEARLVSQRIPFMKLVHLPRGKEKGIKGAVVNVPISVDDTCTSLPRSISSSGIVALKLKRKLSYRGHETFQYIHPQAVEEALSYLKENNPYYQNIEHVGQSSEELQPFQPLMPDLNATHNENTEEQDHTDHLSSEQRKPLQTVTSDVENDSKATSSEDTKNEDQTDHLQSDENKTLKSLMHDASDSSLNMTVPDDESSSDDESEVPDFRKTSSVDTCLQVLPNTDKHIFSIAPGEGRSPVSVFTDKHCEVLSFPKLFPEGRFGFDCDREHKLSIQKYFNARLLNEDPRFATCSEYLFFAQYVSLHKQVKDSVSIAVRKGRRKKIAGGEITVSCIKNPDTLAGILRGDLGYKFLKNIRGTPPYWEKFLYDTMGMLKQLGIVTWFLTLSCADPWWNDTIQIISKQYGTIITTEDIDKMSWEQRSKWINRNPVTAARHFDFRLQTFFKEVLIKHKVLGELTDYQIRIEWQLRGFPHAHCLLWIKEAPKLEQSEQSEVIKFIDKHVSCQVPAESQPFLRELVLALQTHHHTKSCTKRNTSCRFNYPQPPCRETIVAGCEKEEKTQSNGTADETEQQNEIPRLTIPRPWKEVIAAVKSSLQNPNVPESISLDDLLTISGVTEEEYVSALKTSKNSPGIIYTRNPVDVMVNNYNPVVLQAWQANMDLQYVTNTYACVAYVASYVSKDETNMSQLLHAASKEAHNSDIRTEIRKFGNIFLNNREVSSQEAAYHILSLPFHKTSRTVTFIPTDLPDKRVHLLKSNSQIEQMQDDDDDVFQTSLLDRYAARPDSLEDMCLAEFGASFTYVGRQQHDQKEDEDISSDSSAHSENVIIHLKDGLGKMKKRKKMSIVRTHRYSKDKQSEDYYHSLLMMYLPWRIEETDIKSTFDSYSQHFELQCDKVMENKTRFERNADDFDKAYEDFHDNGPPEDAWEKLATEERQQKLDLTEEGVVSDDEDPLINPDYHPHAKAMDIGADLGLSAVKYEVASNILPNEAYRQKVQSLNKEQRQLFDYVLDWCSNVQKGGNKGQHVDPFHTFVTGGAGTGKSHLIGTIYQMAIRKLSTGRPDEVSVLLIAPTGTAAFNIGGSTIHTALGIPIKQHRKRGTVPSLSAERKHALQEKLSSLKLIIIDEISMVGQEEFNIIHQRLQDLKNCNDPNTYFGGVSVLCFGDLYQLPPIGQKAIFADPESAQARLVGSIWKQLFSFHELTIIMRQKEDKTFADLLNKIRNQSFDQTDLNLLEARNFTKEEFASLPNHNTISQELHVFPTREEVRLHNQECLHKYGVDHVTLTAYDSSKDKRTNLSSVSLPADERTTGGLQKCLILAINAKVMIIKNINIEDGLVNGTRGTVKGYWYGDSEDRERNKVPVAIMVKCESKLVGLKTRSRYPNLSRIWKGCVPIFREEVTFSLRSKKGMPTGTEVSRLQFPIDLAWACTVHKVQGMTVEKIVVTFQKKYWPGQAYVALSRAKSLQGLYLINFVPTKILTFKEVHSEMERLRDCCLDCTQVPCRQIQSSHTLTLLNVSSLPAHFKDLKDEPSFKDSEIVCLTETWLKPHHNNTRFAIPKKVFFRQDRPVSKNYDGLTTGGGVAFYLSASLCGKVLSSSGEGNINYLTVQVIIDSRTITVCSIYRAPRFPIGELITSLQTVLDGTDKPDIIVGDFNCEPSKLEACLLCHGYTQTVNQPTHSLGRTLDHIYTNDAVTVKEIYQKSTYYSDHDILTISFA